MEGLRVHTTASTTHAPPLHTTKLTRHTALNRVFAIVYTCAIIALFYHHAHKLIQYYYTTIIPSSLFLSLTLFFSDIILAFMWATTQSCRMRPIHREEFPQNLKEEVKDLPALDVFICTADPYKEPPMSVVNTALSVMAYEYPTEKVSVYVSDDGGSQLTLFALMEATKFACHWLPFCKKKNIVERSPDVYFASNQNQPLSSDDEKIRTVYNSMKARVENIVEKGKVSHECIARDQDCEAFNKWTDAFTRQDHPTVIQILLESDKDKDMTGNVMPNLIYVSREKSRTSPHHFKAGALNVLLRVSATMTNAPIILTLDCDMYSNDPQTAFRVLCYLLDPKIRSNLGYVQFPQRFHGINKNDIYACEFKRLFEINPMGMDGLLGPNHLGTGCFFNRRVFFGGPSSFVPPEIPELSPGNIVNKPIQSQPILAMAHRVASCNYENQSKWGSKVSERWFLLYMFLFLGAYVQDFLDFLLDEGTVQSWWNDQRMWMIRGPSCYLFGLIEYLLKSIGISTHGFNVTSKVLDDEQNERYDQGIFEFGVASPMFVPLTAAAIINLVSFFVGFKEVFTGSNWEGLFVQMFIAGFVTLNCWPIYEAMVLRSDKGMIPTKTTMISTLVALALYTATSLTLRN